MASRAYLPAVLISVPTLEASFVNIHIIVLTVNITFLFVITCLLVGKCTYHKFDNTQAHWGMNFIGRRRRRRRRRINGKPLRHN